MKKLMSVLSLVSILAVSAILGGCSSAKKEAVETSPAVAAPVAEPAATSPVDLGASSAGRGL